MREGGYLRSATGIQIHAGPTQIGKFVRFVRSRLAVEANCSNLSSIGRSDVWHCTPFTTTPLSRVNWGVWKVGESNAFQWFVMTSKIHPIKTLQQPKISWDWLDQKKLIFLSTSLFFIFNQLAFDTSLLWEEFLTTRFKKSISLYIFNGKLAINLRESENRFDKHWVIKILAPQ